MSQVMPIVSIQVEGVDVGDLEFLRDLELAGELIHLLSGEFTVGADQITFTPASGKTFFHIKSKLYPVVDTIITGSSFGSPQTANRRADVELTFDTILKDVLTHDMETSFGNDSGNTTAEGNLGQTGQYETNIFESMIGDGIKIIKLTSTNNSGTYRVSMMGWIQNT